MQNKPTIAVIGGTGDLGSGLARLWAAAGFPIIVGSRAKERAQAKAQELAAQTAGIVRGEDNRGAAQAADVVVLCVPYSNHDATLEEIKPAMDGKILVDAVVPLVPPKVSVVQLPAAGSPAAVAQRFLGPRYVSPRHFTTLALRSSMAARRSIATCWCLPMMLTFAIRSSRLRGSSRPAASMAEASQIRLRPRRLPRS